MDTQTVVTYQVADPFTGERFAVNEDYQARYYYEKGNIVTEFHTTVTMLPPFSQALHQVSTSWHDKDPEKNDPEHESEER
jgi:hypothetical protein